MDRVVAVLNIAARLELDLRVKPLARGKLPQRLQAQAARLLEMAEADRVVGILQTVRALLREAALQAQDADRLAVTRLLDSASRLLRAVLGSARLRSGPTRSEPITRAELGDLLDAADDALRDAVQAQRGIGVDAGKSIERLRAESAERLTLAADLLDQVPRRPRV